MELSSDWIFKIFVKMFPILFLFQFLISFLRFLSLEIREKHGESLRHLNESVELSRDFHVNVMKSRNPGCLSRKGSNLKGFALFLAPSFDETIKGP